MFKISRTNFERIPLIKECRQRCPEARAHIEQRCIDGHQGDKNIWPSVLKLSLT